MKASVLKENFLTAIEAAMRAVPKKPTVNVLSNIVLKTEDSRLRVAAADLDFFVQKFLGAKIDQPGGALVDAKALLDSVKLLPDMRLDLALEDTDTDCRLVVACGETRIRLYAAPYPSDVFEYPALPALQPDVALISAQHLFAALDHVLPFACKEDNRPILMGVNFAADERHIDVAAADGYRLAIDRVSADIDGALPEFTLLASYLRHFKSIFGKKDRDLRVGYDADWASVQFSTGDAIVNVRVMAGKFPALRAVLPASSNSVATLNRNDLIVLLQRVVAFVRSASYGAPMRFSATPGNLLEPGEFRVFGRDGDRGDIEGATVARLEGEASEGGCNAAYLLEALKTLDGDAAELSWNKEDRIVVRAPGQAYPLYMVMPIAKGKTA